MIHIKRFIDKISMMEGRQNKDIVLPISEARYLRDEISKLLLELHDRNISKRNEVIQVEVKGGSFK